MTATAYNPSYRYGDSKAVQLPFKAAVAVNVGDFVFEDETDGYTVKPAMSLAWPTAAAGLTVLQTAQLNFAQRFIGISAQQYDGVNANAYGIQDGNLRVDAGGVFDFSCPSQTFNAGDLLALTQDVGNNLTGQTVTLLATANAGNSEISTSGVNNSQLAVARVVQPYANPTTVVRAELVNTKFSAAAH